MTCFPSALDSYLSLQSNKLNQIMKTLTIASIILMTAALITGFYGQNFKFFPSMDWRIGSFWSLILIVSGHAGAGGLFQTEEVAVAPPQCHEYAIHIPEIRHRQGDAQWRSQLPSA